MEFVNLTNQIKVKVPYLHSRLKSLSELFFPQFQIVTVLVFEFETSPLLIFQKLLSLHHQVDIDGIKSQLKADLSDEFQLHLLKHWSSSCRFICLLDKNIQQIKGIHKLYIVNAQRLFILRNYRQQSFQINHFTNIMQFIEDIEYSYQILNKLYAISYFQNIKVIFSMLKNNKPSAYSQSASNGISPLKSQTSNHQGLNKLLNCSASHSQPTSKKKFQRKNQHSPRDLELIKNRNKSFRLTFQQSHKDASNIKQKSQYPMSQIQKQKIFHSGRSQIVNTLESSILKSPLFIKQTQILKRIQETNSTATKKQISTCQTLIDQLHVEQNKENASSGTQKKINDRNITSIEHLTLRKIQQNSFRPYQKTKKSELQNKNISAKNIILIEQNKKLADQFKKILKEAEKLKKAKTEAQNKYNKLYSQHKQALDYIKILSKQKFSKQCRQLQSFRQMSLQLQISELKCQLQSSREQRQKNLQYQLENSKLLISRLEADVKSLKINSNILERKTFRAELQCRANRKSIQLLSYHEPNPKIYQENKALRRKIGYLEEYLSEIKGMKRKNTNINFQRSNAQSKSQIALSSRVDMEYSDEQDTQSLLLQLDFSDSNK